MKILVVDDETFCRLAIERGLQYRGHTTDGFEDANSALQAFKVGDYDWVLTDFQMVPKNGLWLCEEIKDINRNQKILIQTGDPGYAKRLLGRSLNGLVIDIPVIGKPYSMLELEKIMGLKPPMKVYQP